VVDYRKKDFDQKPQIRAYPRNPRHPRDPRSLDLMNTTSSTQTTTPKTQQIPFSVVTWIIGRFV
jgi:hypothetical protein